MFLKIFDTFSARIKPLEKEAHDISRATRTRTVMWTLELYRGERHPYGRGDLSVEFMREVGRRILYRTGDAQVFSSPGWQGKPEVILDYLFACEGEQFLNFLEDIFSVHDFVWVCGGEFNEFVRELNGLLRIDALPYSLTDFVLETVGSSTYTRAYPQVIMRESEVIYSNSTMPALSLLQRPYFQSANLEYRAALEDYRNADYDDCVAKCCSAFESVLKIICERNQWTYKQTDSAQPLIHTVITKAGLDSFFETPLALIATLRNKRGSAHGAGVTDRTTQPHIAQYALNATASAILLLASAVGES